MKTSSKPKSAASALRRARGRRGLRWSLFAVGFLLSPLTPWNDLLLNVPLSAALTPVVARGTGLDLLEAFAAAYVLTNVLGCVLMGLAAILGDRPRELAPECRETVAPLASVPPPGDAECWTDERRAA